MHTCADMDISTVSEDCTDLFDKTGLGLTQVLSLLLVLEKLGWVAEEDVNRFEHTAISLSDHMETLKRTIALKEQNAKNHGNSIKRPQITVDP